MAPLLVVLWCSMIFVIEKTRSVPFRTLCNALRNCETIWIKESRSQGSPRSFQLQLSKRVYTASRKNMWILRLHPKSKTNLPKLWWIELYHMRAYQQTLKKSENSPTGIYFHAGWYLLHQEKAYFRTDWRKTIISARRLEFFTHMERSPLLAKDCKFWSMFGTHGDWVVRVLECATLFVTRDIRL